MKYIQAKISELFFSILLYYPEISPVFFTESEHLKHSYYQHAKFAFQEDHFKSDHFNRILT